MSEAAIEARLRALEAAVRELRSAPDLDSVMTAAETARAIGKSPYTFSKWLRDANAFERYRLNVLMRRDPTGHWTSSCRLLAQWRQVTFEALQELAR